MNITLSMVLKDYRRHKFKNWRAIDKERDVRLGVVGENRAKNIKRSLPNAI
jgi:hypothetical protein